MENRRVLSWKSWSVIRKAQIIAVGIGAFATIAISLPFTVDKYSPIANVLFDLGMAVAMPTLEIWKAFGNPQGHLLFVVVEVIVNSFSCAVAGTFIGWTVREVKKITGRARL
jgi:hypothetical protein